MKKSKPRLYSSKKLPVVLTGLAVVVAAGAFGVYQNASHKVTAAHAFSQTSQICASNASYSVNPMPFNLCLNAWSGGPAINVYGPGPTNDNFKIIGSSYDNIQFVGGGAHNGWCIGDYGGSSTNARAGLVPGCASGQIGWGVNFRSAACYINGRNAGIQFYNLHWHAYLGPQVSGIGSVLNGYSFYLNKSTPWCFKLYPQ
jgi:hypothetical protein